MSRNTHHRLRDHNGFDSASWITIDTQIASYSSGTILQEILEDLVPDDILSRNATTSSSQGGGFSSDTYVTTSGIQIPSSGLRAGMVFRWIISVSKTAAGTASAVYTVRIGSAQTTSDTSRLALTATDAQTATASSGLIMVSLNVRNVGASGVIAGGVGVMANAGLGTGKDGVSSTFDNTSLAGQYVGLSINAGASASWTITHVSGELIGNR
jgi:hypothetical protein